LLRKIATSGWSNVTIRPSVWVADDVLHPDGSRRTTLRSAGLGHLQAGGRAPGARNLFLLVGGVATPVNFSRCFSAGQGKACCREFLRQAASLQITGGEDWIAEKLRLQAVRDCCRRRRQPRRNRRGPHRVPTSHHSGSCRSKSAACHHARRLGVSHLSRGMRTGTGVASGIKQLRRCSAPTSPRINCSRRPIPPDQLKVLSTTGRSVTTSR
jgi:hypothetical protein